VFDLPHVNAGLWADVMVVRRVGTLPVPNLVVLAKLSVRHEMQATLKLEDGSKAMVCDFLVLDIDMEMLGSTLDEALVYKNSFNDLTLASPMAGLADYGRPSTPQILRYMKVDSRDYSVPIYPSKPGFRFKLKNKIADFEWAQMFYGEKFTDEMQLKATSKQAYYGGQLKGIEFLDRYPTEQEFSAAHAGTGIDFDPAVWKSSELQKVLCDLAMHDAYVRGNAWSTVRQMLYAIRHYNVRHQGYDILKGKPRLWQLMDGLKKFKGPKPGKCPVTRAMLLMIERMLNYGMDEDELRMWASILMAFHFMLRSMDYCAKLAQGKFDMDNVIRICDLIFKRDGEVMESNFSQGDEMIAVLGRGKTTPGGEVRSQFKSENAKLCVVRVVGLLMEKIQHKKKTTPLFAWADKSKRPGEGVRYCDIMSLVKDAAEACGRDTSKYGSHSLRRGGACAYLQAGVDVHMIAIWGRWADVKTVQLYIEPAVASLMKGAQDKVNNGEVEPNLKLRAEERPRAEQIRRARKATEEL